jgi:pimeloyl-ACP methyl ester carboxylesterase
MPYFTTSDNCRIYYETKGFGAQKPVVVFLNGTIQTTLNWWPLAGGIKDRFQVLMYDARAQGRSDLGKQKLSLGGHAADLSNLLDDLNVTRCNLVGVSHGAHLALAMADAFPRRVERMILCGIGSEFTPETRIIIKAWRRILASGGIEALAWAMLPFVFGEAFLKDHEGKLGMIVKTMVHRNNEKALSAHLDALTSYPPPSRMAKALETPAVIISGAEDHIAPGEKARKLAQLCKGRHIYIKDAGHSVPIEMPKLFAQTVVEYFKTLPDFP